MEEKNSYPLITFCQEKALNQKELWKEKILATLSGDKDRSDIKAWQFKPLSASQGVCSVYPAVGPAIESLIPIPLHLYDNIGTFYAIAQFESAMLSLMTHTRKEVSSTAFLTYKNQYINKDFEKKFPQDKLHLIPYRLYFTAPLAVTKFKLFSTEPNKIVLPSFCFFFAFDPVKRTVEWIQPSLYTSGLISYENLPYNYSAKPQIIHTIFRQYVVKMRCPKPENYCSANGVEKNTNEPCRIL